MGSDWKDTTAVCLIFVAMFAGMAVHFSFKELAQARMVEAAMRHGYEQVYEDQVILWKKTTD